MVNKKHNTPGPPIASKTKRSLVAAAALFAVVAALWVPFGLHTTPRGDGWVWMDHIANGERWVFLQDPTRLFIFVPWTLAYFLSPDTFVGVHLILIAVLWGAGLVLFKILVGLRGMHDGLAFAVAALSIVYPASNWRIALESPVDRHWAVFFFLVSVLALLATWRRPSLPLLVGMWLAQIMSLWTNQAILPLALAVPFLLLWTSEGNVSRREFLRGTILWLALPVVNGFHNIASHYFNKGLFGGTGGLTHEAHILDLGAGWAVMTRSVLVAYRKHLFDGWSRSVSLLAADPSLLLVAVVTGVVVLVTTWALWPRREGVDRGAARFLVIAGLLGIGLGFALFVPTSLRFTEGRSFIVSSLGGALFIPGLIGILFGRLGHARAVAVGLTSLLVCLGTIRVLDQHARYIVTTRRMDSILAAIIRQAPDVRPGVFFAVVYAGERGEFWRTAGFSLRSNVVQHALRYLYDNQELGAGVINEDWTGSIHYRLKRDGLGVRSLSGGEFPTISYSDVLIFRIRRNLKVLLLNKVPQRVRGPDADTYDPENLIDLGAPLPRRFRALGE